MLRRNDALIQAERSTQTRLELGVVKNVIVGQRLLNQQQVELVQQGQMVSVFEMVDAVGVDLQLEVRPSLAHGACRLDVPARLDLELDARIALIKIRTHPLQQRIDIRLDANADADLHAITVCRPTSP